MKNDSVLSRKKTVETAPFDVEYFFCVLGLLFPFKLLQLGWPKFILVISMHFFTFLSKLSDCSVLFDSTALLTIERGIESEISSFFCVSHALQNQSTELACLSPFLVQIRPDGSVWIVWKANIENCIFRMDI